MKPEEHRVHPVPKSRAPQSFRYFVSHQAPGAVAGEPGRGVEYSYRVSSEPRRPWVAVVLAVFCAGLGHLYAGRPVIAVALQGVALSLGLAFSAALRAGFAATTAVAATGLAFWVGQALHAARTARRSAGQPRTASSRPLALVAFYVATLALSAVVVPAVRARVAHTVYVPSGAMIPTVLIGDYLAIASGKPSALRGAVVVHAAPIGAPRRDPLLKRVVAVGGDTVEIRGGALWVNDAPMRREPGAPACVYANRSEGGAWQEEGCVDFVEALDGHAYHTYCTPALPCGDVQRQTVPAGRVWVAGDHRDHSADSRVYGPIPEDAILGEARWVLFSVGPGGVRWGRIGRTVQ